MKIKRHLKPIFIIALTAFWGTIYNQIDITMLGFYSNDSVIGYYANAHKIILLAVSCCIAVTTVFMPRLSFYYENDREALSDLINFGVKLLFFIVLPASIGLWLISSDLVVVLFGESFEPAGLTVALFSPMLLIRPLGDLLCYQLLISAGREQKRFYTSLLACIVNIALNIVLIPIWKQNGAAVASVIAEIIVNGLLFREVAKIVKINMDIKYYLKLILASVTLMLILLAISQMVDARLSRLILSILLGGCSYFLANFILKNDVVLIILNKLIKTNRKCVRGELK